MCLYLWILLSFHQGLAWKCTVPLEPCVWWTRSHSRHSAAVKKCVRTCLRPYVEVTKCRIRTCVDYKCPRACSRGLYSCTTRDPAVSKPSFRIHLGIFVPLCIGKFGKIWNRIRILICSGYVLEFRIRGSPILCHFVFSNRNSELCAILSHAWWDWGRNLYLVSKNI